MHWRRKWQPTPVFLPGESQGWRSLVGCHLWRRTELDATKATAAAAPNLITLICASCQAYGLVSFVASNVVIKDRPEFGLSHS